MTYDLLRVGNINIVVYSLVVMFAIAFWLNINGLWVELPILVQKLPERWDLPSYMSVVIQVATIGPLVYTIIYTACPHRNLEIPVIYTIISIEIVVCFLLVFFWDTVKTVGEELHSVGLLGLQFCVAVADTTSTLVCLPFLAAFQPQYLTAFYIGEGLSGLLPSLVSLAQGAGDISCYNFTTMQNVSDDNKTVTVAESASKPLYQNPRFPVEILFVILLGLLVLSLLSFMLLNVWNYARRTAGDEKFALQDQECHNHSKLPNTECELKLQSTVKGTSLTCAESPETSVHCCNEQVSPPGSGDEVGDVAFDKQQDQEVRVELKVIERRHDALLLILIGWISSLAYGVLPSVQPYSCLPYGIHRPHCSFKMSPDFFRVRNTNVVVFLLVVMFAISSWVDINGLWVELPILVQKLPEGWDLPSYMAVIIQVANVAPLAYTITHTACPRINLEVPVIYTIISTGAVACLLLVFFWDTVETVAGELHSVGLLGLQFFLALVDCTSSVAYLPFMAAFQPQYLTAFYIGEGLSGLLPSLVSLAQGAGDISCYNFTTMRNVSDDNKTVTVAESVSYPVYQTPRFSIEVFFCFLLAMLLVSLLAFTLLNFWPYTKREAADRKHALSDQACPHGSRLQNGEHALELQSMVEGYSVTSAENTQENLTSCNHLLSSPVDNDGIAKAAGVSKVRQKARAESKKLKRYEYILLLALTSWVSGLSNGVLPSLQSYSCLPYGIRAFHLAVALASIANPAACFVTMFLQVTTVTAVTVLVAVGSLLSSCALYTSATSPEPPLSDHTLGPFLVVTLWVLVVFVLTYTKVSMATLLRMEGKRALLWCGAVTQGGSLVGAVITFVLVNVYKLFKQAIVCN